MIIRLCRLCAIIEEILIRCVMYVVVMSLVQVKVLALTDHDTMSGVPEALEAAYRFGIKIIPGVEISSVFSTRQVVHFS